MDTISFIKAENTSYRAVLEDAKRSFPISHVELIVDFEKPAKEQAFGVFETLALEIDPALLNMLIGAGAVLTTVTASKISELVAKDFYEWGKRPVRRQRKKKQKEGPGERLCRWIRDDLFKQICEAEGKLVAYDKSGRSTHGVRLHIRPREGAGDVRVDTVFWISFTRKENETYHVSKREFAAEFYVFENIIRPVVRYVELVKGLRDVVIMGIFGPGEEKPRWQLALYRSDIEGFDIHAEMTTSGSITDWGGEDSHEANLLKEALLVYPPFVGDKITRLMQWKNCAELPEGKATNEVNLTDYDEGWDKGYNPCDSCFLLYPK